MIDTQSETVLSFAEAAKKVPPRRRGKRVAQQTLYRWAFSGIGGVKLESVRIGNCWYTSIQALERFYRRLSIAKDPTHEAAQALPTDFAARDEVAKRELLARGA